MSATFAVSLFLFLSCSPGIHGKRTVSKQSTPESQPGFQTDSQHFASDQDTTAVGKQKENGEELVKEKLGGLVEMDTELIHPRRVVDFAQPSHKRKPAYTHGYTDGKYYGAKQKQQQQWNNDNPYNPHAGHPTNTHQEENLGSGCFPGNALVHTLSGLKQMEDLRVGETVLSVDEAGILFNDYVYFFGHADAAKHATYVKLEVQGNLTLQLSPKHFIPRCPINGRQCAWNDHIQVYASSVLVGDFVWSIASEASGKAPELREVQKKSFSKARGLFNPYTLSGKIVVNGVMASAHSDWILDDWIPDNYVHHLPSMYQQLFLPGRVLYRLLSTLSPSVLHAVVLMLDVNNPQVDPEKYGKGPEFLIVSSILSLCMGYMVVKAICAGPVKSSI